MKNKQLKIKLTLLAALFLFAGVLTLSAQTRHVSKLYNIAFQIPKNSVKSADSTEKEINYEETGQVVGGYLQIMAEDSFQTEALSRALSSNINKDALIDEFIKGIKEELNGAPVTVLEKKGVKIAGLSSYKIVTVIKLPDIKLRSATFIIPVPEHKRTYIFNISALESDFDRWYKVAEASVNSFEVLKPNENMLTIMDLNQVKQQRLNTDR